MKDQGWLKMEETNMDYNNNNKLQDAFRPISYTESPGWSAGGHQNARGLWDWRNFRKKTALLSWRRTTNLNSFFPFEQKLCKLTRTFTSLPVSLETTIACTISPSITGSVCPTRDSFTFVTCYKKQKYNNINNGIWVAIEALRTACIQNREEKQIRHVAIVAKFLYDNKPNGCLNMKWFCAFSNSIDLFQFHLICQMLAKFSGVESETTEWCEKKNVMCSPTP